MNGFYKQILHCPSLSIGWAENKRKLRGFRGEAKIKKPQLESEMRVYSA
jgi:hypothetical protein